MILPIYVYGNEVLRKQSELVDSDHPELKELIANMYETMYAADGVGLSACQIGLPLTLFVVDVSDFYADDQQLSSVGDDAQKEPFRRVFINAEIVEFSDDQEPYREGCLSVPGINEIVVRPNSITVRYFDQDFVEHTQKFDSMWARVIQHEYDHTNGELFSDHVAPIRRQMLRGKLQTMAKGGYKANYRCR